MCGVCFSIARYWTDIGLNRMQFALYLLSFFYTYILHTGSIILSIVKSITALQYLEREKKIACDCFIQCILFCKRLSQSDARFDGLLLCYRDSTLVALFPVQLSVRYHEAHVFVVAFGNNALLCVNMRHCR